MERATKPQPDADRPTTDTETFFASLSSRGNDPLLAKVSGTIRFDAIDGERVEHWYVALDRGTLRISRRNSKADAVVRGDHALFDAIFRGRENATAAILRGALIPEGDLGLLLRFERVFAGGPPSDPVPPTATAGGAR